jgi:hypothetical protein
MLIPTKHENLNQNAMVIGANVLLHLKKRNLNIETLFQKIKSEKSITLEQYYNTLLFLWLAELIKLEGYLVSLKKTNDPQ